MLYDDEQQIEVRHVISLAHHDVSIYGGGEDIPEGELYAKRNAICLVRKEDSIADLRGLTPPFYLFCQNQSDKEDFYHALLKNQERIPNSPNSPPSSQLYNVKDIVKLVQDLHASEEHLQTRWINALIGRWFLAMYKTPEMYEFIQTKITKKISRVPKPNFISHIALQKIDMGQGAPSITNPRLKDLTVDGDCTVEADVNYSGNIRIEISATARIDLGPRIKTREVNLILAVVLKKLTGHVLIRFKPPPSNRVWFCFASKPDMTMSIEPVVSARQITYGIILRAIESRIREVVEETLVFPYWDDIPFLDTASFAFRGGVWQREIPKIQVGVEIPDESEARESEESVAAIPAEALRTKDERSWSTPDFIKTNTAPLRSTKSFKSTLSDSPLDEVAASSAVDKRNSSSPLEAIRARTFSNVAEPIITPDHGKADKTEGESPKADKRTKTKRDATSSMIEIKSRSQSNSISSTSYGSPLNENFLESASFRDHATTSSATGTTASRESGNFQRPGSSNSEAMSSTVSLTSSINSSEETIRKGKFESINRSFTQSTSSDKRSTATAIGTATAAAKKWGWNVLNKADQRRQPGDTGPKPGTPEHPIGRGRPLPPPGTPLPPPQRSGFMTGSISMPKRKPVPPLPGQFSDEKREEKRPVPPPPLPKRKKVPIHDTDNSAFTDDLLVIEAPVDSEPNSPAIANPPPLPSRIEPDAALRSSSSSEMMNTQSQEDKKSHESHFNDEEDDEHSDSGFERISGSSTEDIHNSPSPHKKHPTTTAVVHDGAGESIDKPDSRTQSHEDLLL
jgi:Maintenance of mitochondrial morphology protein 1